MLRYFICMILLLAGSALSAADAAVTVAGPGRILVMPPGECRFGVTVFSAIEGMEATAELAGVQTNKYKVRSTQPLKSGKNELGFTFIVPGNGLYELVVTVHRKGDEREFLARSATYCLIAPAAEPVPDLGVQTHLRKWRNMEQLLDYVKYVGFTRIRDEVYWSVVEQQPGKFVYPEDCDRMIRLAGDRGLKVLLILDYGNPNAYPELFPKARTFPANDEMHELFLAYVENNVKRYGATVKDWELWNEPNHVKPVPVYLPLLRKVHAKIKELDPAATVVSCGGGGAGGGPSGAYIVPIVKAGGADAQDAFSIHPYMAPANPDQGYGPCKGSPIPFVNVPAVWKFLGNFCEQNKRSDGKALRFWVTEVGWPTGEGRNTCSELEQAAYLSRLLLQHRRAGNAEALFIYDLLSDGVRSAEAEHNFGMLRADLSPKPSFAAVATFLREVGNLRHSADISDETVKVFRYGEVIALYSLEKSPKYILELPEVNKVRLIQWDGYETEREVKDGKIELRLSLLPTYVRILQ